MMRHPSRLVPLAAVAVLALGACGSDESGDAADATTAAPPAESSDDGLMAPRPIEVSSGGAGGAATESAALESAEADKAMATDMIAPYQVTTFVAGDALPALPTNDIGYFYDSGTTVSAEQVAGLAAALGVEGEPQRIDEGGGWVYWQVGPQDGSAPTLTVTEDAQMSWNYGAAWANQTVTGVACASAGSTGSAGAAEVEARAAEARAAEIAIDTTAPAPPDEPASEPVTCETPAPPEGVPTADEAEARTRELMTAVGIDPATFEFEPYGDEWSASVTATEKIDGIATGRTFNTSFGAEGVMQYAGGQLAEPVSVGPYPLVDLETAIARLNDPGIYGGFYGGGIALDTAVASRDVAMPEPAVGVDVAEADVAAVDPAVAPEPAPAPVDTDAPDSGGGTDAVPPASAVPPVSAVPVEVPAPQEITVTLVDVQPDVWWVWDVEQSVWLLPAYRFIGDDGGWYTVPAVTDEFLVQVPVETVPPVTEPAVPPSPDVSPVPPETSSVDAVADTTALESSIGKTLADFTADAEALGLTVRVVEQDGVPLPATMDYNPLRINVAVEGEGDTATVTAIVNVG